MEKQIKTIGVLTSGGDAPGMNAAVRAVVRTGLHKGYRMIGIQRGYNGLLNGECFEMNLRSVSNIISAGGTILYTARCLEFKTKEGQDRGAAKCRELGIDALVVIGGDGSYRGARELAHRGIPMIGLPGTIDNDIASTEYTIGYDTAMNTALEMIDKLRDTTQSHDRCSVVEVMGRNAGYIALNVGIATGAINLAGFAQAVYNGFCGMNEVFFLTLLCGGMSELIAKNGGIEWIIQKLGKVMKGNKSAQVGIAAMVSLCDCATANNTVAIIVAGDMAREVSHEYKVDPRRTASLLDMFSCVFQGIIPYGAQLLSAAALANATVTSDALHTSPAAIVGGMWYCWILAAVGLLSIFVPFADGVCRKDPWNWEYGCAQSAVAAKKALLEKEAEDIPAQ